MKATKSASMKQKQTVPVYMNYRSYRTQPAVKQTHSDAKHPKHIFAFIVVVALIAVGAVGIMKLHTAKSNTPGVERSVTTLQTKSTSSGATVASSNQCANNTVDQLLLVSISQRHLWACDKTTQEYDTAVITGDTNVPADVTPVGTYSIYEKQTDLYLNGSDSRGSWHDWVNYWMPFLSNEYGVFGLHDATWRTSTDFGTISPSSDQASHGCVELPLAAAAWIYQWSSVGTTVTIEN